MDWFPTLTLRTRALEVMARLHAQYQQATLDRGHCARLPPVDELVLTILSQSTTDINSGRGYQALRARFADWDAVADAADGDIEQAIRPAGLARQKAPRIKALLQRIRAEHGTITLDHLAQMPPDEALTYLMSFHGVGRKTASCVLLFSLAMPAMPVDTHVLRVTTRLELIPPDTSADQAHDLLEALLPEEAYLSFHLNVIAHGRRVCTARHPRCPACVLLEMCPTGQQAFRRGTGA